MNKVIFNEGGQPVYLDDLRHLQECPSELMESMVACLGGSDGGMLLEPLRVSTAISDDATLDDRGYATKGGVTVTIHANKIIHGGNIIPFAATALQTYGADIMVGIRQTMSDARIFADGQSRTCREVWTAILYCDGEVDADAEHIVASYRLFDLESLDEVAARRLGVCPPETRWKQLPVVFYNGYSGSVRYTIGSTPRMKVCVRSSEKKWAPEDPSYIENNDNPQFAGLIGILMSNPGTGWETAPSPYYLLRPDGTAMHPFNSRLSVTNPRNKLVVDNWPAEISMRTRGLVPPCDTKWDYGEIIATMTGTLNAAVAEGEE